MMRLLFLLSVIDLSCIRRRICWPQPQHVHGWPTGGRLFVSSNSAPNYQQKPFRLVNFLLPVICNTTTSRQVLAECLLTCPPVPHQLKRAHLVWDRKLFYDQLWFCKFTHTGVKTAANFTYLLHIRNVLRWWLKFSINYFTSPSLSAEHQILPITPLAIVLCTEALFQNWPFKPEEH